MRLTINDIRYIINESKKLLLTEISNNAIETLFKRYMPEYRELLDNTLGFMDTGEYEYDDMPLYYYLNLIGVPSDVIKSSPDMKLKDYFRLAILKEFEINRGKGPVQFLRGIIRICCSDSDIKFFNKTRLDEKKLKTFKQLIKYIYNNNIEMDGDFNGMSFAGLYKALGKDMRVRDYVEWHNNQKDKDTTGTVQGEYIVKPMYGFDDTSKYTKYTPWCVTYDIGNYRAYTGDGSQFFFCLKKGFENVPEEMGEGCPLDEYGLSMVSVLMYPNGTAKLVTTRWNHEHDGENHYGLRTLEDIEKKLGISKSVFLSSIAPEIEIDDIKEILKNGINIDREFSTCFEKDDFRIIKYNKGNIDLFNALNGYDLLSDVWYTKYDSLNYALGIYMLSRMDDAEGYVRNVFSPEGKIFPKDIPYAIKLFDYNKGLYCIYTDRGKQNLVYKGNIQPILPEFVDFIAPYVEGYALIRDNGGINFMCENGEMLWEGFKFFPEMENIDAAIIRNNKTIMLMTVTNTIAASFIDLEGNYIAPTNLKPIAPPNGGTKGVYFKDEANGDIYNFINETGDIRKIK